MKKTLILLFFALCTVYNTVLGDTYKDVYIDDYGSTHVNINNVYYQLNDYTHEAFVEINSLDNKEFYRGVVTIPPSIRYKNMTYKVVEIHVFTFENCQGLRRVTLPNTINRIGMSAFQNCKILTNINIPSSVQDIEYTAFNGCENLKFNEYDSVLYLGNDENPYHALIKPKSNDITKCEINKRCRIISDGAFNGCHKLTNVIIHDNVITIGASAFEDCYNLRSIVMPIGIKEIKFGTFEGCRELESITIPNGVKTIWDKAFKGCHNLTNVTIPDNVEDISQEAFAECKKLRDIQIPNKVKRIGQRAFMNCSSLETVTITEPSSIISIKENAFLGCYSLKNHMQCFYTAFL